MCTSKQEVSLVPVVKMHSGGDMYMPIQCVMTTRNWLYCYVHGDMTQWGGKYIVRQKCSRLVDVQQLVTHVCGNQPTNLY